MIDLEFQWQGTLFRSIAPLAIHVMLAVVNVLYHSLFRLAGGERIGGFVRMADLYGQSDARFTSNLCSVNDLGARAQIGPYKSF